MSSGPRLPSGFSSEWAIPRFFGRTEVFLPTGTESAGFDRWAMDQAGVPSPVLMENAGRSAALVLSRVFPDGKVLVFAGPGNNGGDGLVLARTLAASGREVEVFAVGARAGGAAGAGRQSPREALLHGWPIEVKTLPDGESELAAAVAQSDVVVDALLGTGAREAPKDPFPRAIRAMNAAGAATVALDLPSGVDPDTGSVAGEAVEADLTVAFGAPKLGTTLFPGRSRTGRLVAVEIGFPPVGPAQARARLVTPGWASERRPRRPAVTHKKAEGRLLVLAGSPGVAGAAVLAARGALRAGAGYVRVASHPDNREVIQRSAPEAIFVDVMDREALDRAAADSDALAAGPGMGTDREAAALLDHVLVGGRFAAVLLDADALTLLGAGALPTLSAGRPYLLTPHPGELVRLGADPEEVRADPLAACARESRRRSAVVLLKGRPSVVSDPGEGLPLWVSGTGSSDLSRAGMGDVLTGVAGAFLARGSMPSEAACLALHYTGRAAALANLGDALLPSDVAEHLGAAFQEPPLGLSDLAGSSLGLPFVTLDLDPVR